MPPARPTSAAAEETGRRARGGGSSQRGRNRNDVNLPSPTSNDVGVGGGPAEGDVDWDAIFKTIDGQAGHVPRGIGHHRLEPASSSQQGHEVPGLHQQRHGSTSMSAGPSSSSHFQQQSQFPSPIDEPWRSTGHPPAWSTDFFHLARSGLASAGLPRDRSDPFPYGDTAHDGPSSRSQSPARPPAPSRSQSYPFYTDPFNQSPAEHPLNQLQSSFMPPPPNPFGLPPLTSEPNSFGSGSGSSISSLLNNRNGDPYHNFNYTPLTSPTHPPPDPYLSRTLSNMDPPPPGPHRGQSSISRNPFDFSGPSSVNPSPAPTPLSNPPSGEDTEDKRVRNTVASAKFRAKKKEQIASVQRTITDLEVQQAALEVDVASLRNENGLLREMVQIKYGTKIPEN